MQQYNDTVFCEQLGQELMVVVTLVGIMLGLAIPNFRDFIRNSRLRPKSNLQSATGIRHPQVAQKSMGMTGGSFNTREFMHGRTRAFVARIKFFAIGAGFVVPALLLLPALASGGAAPGGWLLLAVAVQCLGLLAERWYFFAQARHPQNLYYQVVS